MRMRLLPGLLILAGLVGLACGSLEAAESELLHTYTLGASGMALTAPGSWQATRDQDGAVLVLRSPVVGAAKEPQGLTAPGDHQGAERARGSVSVAIQELRSAETPDAFASRCRVDLERLGTGVVVTGQDPVTLGGRPWTRLSYHMQLGRFIWQQQLYATSIGGMGYCVTCSCVESEFAQWTSAFAAILASLEHSRPTLEGTQELK